VLLLAAQTAAAADLNGNWRFVFSNFEGDFPRTISLEVDGEKVTGKHDEEVFTGTFKDGQLELSGKHYAGEAGYSSTLTISGKFEGEELKGDGRWDTYSLTFVAERVE
jgi:hypothetical protein